MKKNQLKELHIKSPAELGELIKKAQNELVKLKIDLGLGKLKNVHLVVQKRHDLARLKTILKEKELS